MYAPPLAGSDGEAGRCDGFGNRMVDEAGSGAGQWPRRKESGGHGIRRRVLEENRA